MSHKRIIVCCDGTWQDGLDVNRKWKYTNILRLARAINHMDDRVQPPVHQVVFYQPGIGTENLYDKVVDGVTGATLVSKVEDAYAFIAQNYRPGDEIFLFGFSRGAYTARMVAMFIGAIGVLDRTQMDHFATIFLAYQKRGKAQDSEEVRQLDEQLAPWTSPDSIGKKRVNLEANKFSVKVIGVFDTVGSVGLPEELTFRSEKIKSIFGFPDKLLGHHVERAYQALALNETRADFDCAKFEQTDAGRRSGQVLKQCWFTGSHCDIGGGFEQHDLSDLTLNWLIANIGDVLSLDYDYVASLPRPDLAWGTQPPHNPLTGIYSIAKTIQRVLPTSTNDVTHETIHSSVVKQAHLVPELKSLLDRCPNLVCPLLPWEEEVKTLWDAKIQTRPTPNVAEPILTQMDDSGPHHHHTSFVHKYAEVVDHLKHGDSEQRREGQLGPHTEYVHTWLGKVVTESSVGVVVQELFK